MKSSAYQRLLEQIKLRKLRAAVAQVEGSEALEDKILQGDAKISAITEAIRDISSFDQDGVAGAESFSFNEKQQEFINAVISGEPVALTGPAGSGKTTAVKGAIRELIQSGRVMDFGSSVSGHRHLDPSHPGIVCTAFTNKAVENMKKVLPKSLRSNCITIHKLLEYAPEYFEVLDEKTGVSKKTMQFLPKYHETNPLPSGIQVLIIDEASMVAVDLWNVLAAAIHHRLQVILIGDIQQLPPVFGKPIFIYAMQYGVKRVELTEVHRQALESPIISLAHKILQGKQVHAPKLPELNYNGEHGVLLVKPWKKQLSDVGALKIMNSFLPELMEAGQYDPLEDVILTPFNVNFGTEELNKIVATHLVESIRKEAPDSEEAYVHEIIAGIKTKYFRIGDKVLHNKTEHVITSITRNKKYLGKHARISSKTMNYRGQDASPVNLEAAARDNVEEVDDILESMAFNLEDLDGEKEARKQACSHVIELYSSMLDTKCVLETSGEVGNLDLGYALTVHKSQGSEYNRVLFITHHTQANMFFRELIYTAVTRAKKELFIICPPSLLVQGINTQRMPGSTLDQKIAAFDRLCQLQKGAAEKPEKMWLFKSSQVGDAIKKMVVES